MCYWSFGLVTFLAFPPLLVAASALMQDQPGPPKSVELTLAGARTAIGVTYVRWGRARVSIDKKELESILAPTFYVSL